MSFQKTVAIYSTGMGFQLTVDTGYRQHVYEAEENCWYWRTVERIHVTTDTKKHDNEAPVNCWHRQHDKDVSVNRWHRKHDNEVPVYC